MPSLATAIASNTVEFCMKMSLYMKVQHVSHDFIYVMKTEERSMMVLWLNTFPKDGEIT